MKVSIITPSYNSASTIADCITSVSNQSCRDLEHIIIDGASVDDTLQIVKSIPNRVSRTISEPDSGIYSALNKGIELAEGDIIGLLHTDDVFASDTVIEQVRNLFLERNADIVYGDLTYVSRNNGHKPLRYWKSRPFEISLLSKGWMPAHPSMFIKRDVYKRYGLFDLNYRISSDYDLMLRFLRQNDLRVEYLPVLITKMKTGGASNRSIRNIIRKSTEDYIIIRKHHLPHPLLVLAGKNFGKINQFFMKEQMQ